MACTKEQVMGQHDRPGQNAMTALHIWLAAPSLYQTAGSCHDPGAAWLARDQAHHEVEAAVWGDEGDGAVGLKAREAHALVELDVLQVHRLLLLVLGLALGLEQHLRPSLHQAQEGLALQAHRLLLLVLGLEQHLRSSMDEANKACHVLRTGEGRVAACE